MSQNKTSTNCIVHKIFIVHAQDRTKSNFILYKNFTISFFPQNITIKFCDGKKYNFSQCICVEVKGYKFFVHSYVHIYQHVCLQQMYLYLHKTIQVKGVNAIKTYIYCNVGWTRRRKILLIIITWSDERKKKLCLVSVTLVLN